MVNYSTLYTKYGDNPKFNEINDYVADNIYNENIDENYIKT